MGQVAEAQCRSGVVAIDDDQGRTRDLERSERSLGIFRPRSIDPPALDDDDLVVGCTIGERRAKCGLDHLLRRLLVVLAGLRAVGHTTTGELRRPDRALPGIAGALLGVRLGATTPHLGPGLGALRARAAGGELRRDDLVHERNVGLDAEHLVVQFNGAGVGAGRILEGERAHVQLPFPASLTALRTTTTPPAGPGTEPLTSKRLRSTSDCTTSRFCVVTCS